MSRALVALSSCAAVLTLIAFLASCAGDERRHAAAASTDAPVASTASALISDAVHSAGTRGFYFLPPMVDQPDAVGAFVAAANPSVRIDHVGPGGSTVAMIAEYTMTNGPFGVRVTLEDEHFKVLWHTQAFDLDPALTYRIRVFTAGRQIGFADVDLVGAGSQLRQVDANQYIPLLDGRTLPIKFRINQPAAYVLGSTGGTMAATSGTAELDIPAGALASDTLLSADAEVDACALLPGTVHVFGPDTLSLNPAGTLRIWYQPSTVPPPEPESELTIVRVFEDGTCEDVAGSTVDAAGDRVSAPVTILGHFGVGLRTRSVALSPSALVLTALGNTVDLDAVPRSLSGLTLDRRVAFSVADGSVVSVSASGLVTALAVGSTRASARSSDVQGFADVAVDLCPSDTHKLEPGVCGCGVADGDTDGDGTADCTDGCPADVLRIVPDANDASCDGIDDDCDGRVDEAFVVSAASCGVGACAATGSTICVSGAIVNGCTPGAAAADDASCDGIDDDCDGRVDEAFVVSAASCGVGACAATGSTICVSGAIVNGCTPGAAAADDASCNGVDDDCNGEADEDYATATTSCGIGACAATGSTSCVTGSIQNSCTPGTPSADDAACDGVNSDCDAATDENYVSQSTSCGVGACLRAGSTSCASGAVQDSCSAGSPAADDASCNGIDDDCQGTIDEDYVSQSTSCGIGACAAAGTTSCVTGSVHDSCTVGTAAPSDASCDGVDNDCDAATDESFGSQSTSCGVGVCVRAGSTSCTNGAEQNSCSAGAPGADDASCNGVDDDCQGAIDEDYVPQSTSCGIGACASTGSTSCVAGAVQDGCTAGTPAASDATCNGIDDDCEGQADEDFVAFCSGNDVNDCETGQLVSVNCVDGNACNGSESCAGGACQPGTPSEIDDYNDCTADSCDPASGAVTHAARVDAVCDDENLCTEDDRCNAQAECVPGVSVVYDDGNPCTVHTCDPLLGIQETECPPLAADAPSSVAEQTAWLYTGTNPIQVGVATGTIERVRAALVRGRVLDATGAALPGTTVRVHDHPELGSTQSQLNGEFNLVANGGGILTLDFEQSGYLSAQRTVEVPWADTAHVPDVALIALTPKVDEVVLSDMSETFQVAQSDVVTDSDGSRQATLLFGRGTTAFAQMPDGSEEPLDVLHVRATEYTVGAIGQAAMPADLPPGVLYTYAVELSVDEAEQMGADSVVFDRPVPLYVDNFLEFPVGGIVPSAYYDPIHAQWVPNANGRVVAITDVVWGRAAIDINGDGLADDATALLALGITDDERDTLGARYAVGKTLWRVALTHFSTIDLNWPGSAPPSGGPAGGDDDSDEPPNDCQYNGSVIECARQVLGESVPLAGTPFDLHYRSDRVPGRTRPIRVQLTAATVNPSVIRVVLEVRIAGQLIRREFLPTPNQTTEVTWDHLDGFGRYAAGAAVATVRLGYVFRTQYRVPRNIPATWGWMSNVQLENPTRGEQTIWAEWKDTNSGWDQRGTGLGGWSLDPHHVYDPTARVLYYGDGERKTTQALPAAVRAFAGSGAIGAGGDGAQAPSATLSIPSAVVAAADGSAFIADFANNNIRKVSTDGVISTFFGGSGGSPNLIRNPGGEELTAGTIFPGWTEVLGNWAHRGGAPDPFEGLDYFSPGAIAVGELAQDIDVSSYAPSIDAGTQGFELQAFVRSFTQTPTDAGTVVMEYRNAANTVLLASYGSGEIASTSSWQRVSARRAAPPGTRTVRIRLIATRHSGSNNDGYFDGLSLRPVPMATPPIRLINGDSHEPVPATNQVPGWTAISGAWTSASAASLFDGNPFFYAGASLIGELQQDTNVSALAASIDAGTQRFSFTGRVRSVLPDSAQVLVEYRSASSVLSTFDSGEIRNGSTTTWQLVSDSRFAPVGTRVIRVRIISRRSSGTSNDGYFDALELNADVAQPIESLSLSGPMGLTAGPDGSLYVADMYNNRVVRIGVGGDAQVIAGNGVVGSAGDGGPALAASLSTPTGVAVTADGSVYIADYGNHKVRRVAPDGTIATVAGTGVAGYNGNAIDATTALLYAPMSVAVDKDGLLYIADTLNHRIRRVTTDGIIGTYAGTGSLGFVGDGGAPTSAQLNRPSAVTVGSDGTLYIADAGNRRIRRVGAGLITTLAGRGELGNAGDGGSALQAQLSYVSSLAVAPDGSLLLTDRENHRVRRLAPALPGLSVGDMLIARDGGDLVDVFDARGRHLQTLHGRTGTLVYDFGYDGSGALSSITDQDGNQTRIDHDAFGRPTVITGPYGQTTTLEVSSQGYLSSVTGPMQQTTELAYGADGLLTSLIDARNFVHTYVYDADGRLTRDNEPAGGFTTLTRTEVSPSVYTVQLSKALDQPTTHRVTRQANGSFARVITLPGGAINTQTVGAEAVTTTTLATGMVQTDTRTGDPRFGLAAPVVQSVTRAPSGLTRTQVESRSVVLEDPSDPLSVLSTTESRSVNGLTTTSVFDAATSTRTTTSPLLRTSVVVTDESDRMLSTQRGSLEPFELSYDARGRLETMSQASRVTTLGYDVLGNLATSTNALQQTDSYEYDALGRLISHLRADGESIELGYDEVGNITSVTPPGRPAHLFTFTPDNRVESYQAPDAGDGAPVTLYSYDLNGRMQSIERPDGAFVEVEYDSAGRLSTMTGPQGTTARTYNATTGLLTAITGPAGVNLSYAYNGSLLTSTTWSGSVSGSMTRTYDSFFRVASESVNGSSIATFTYDNDGLALTAGQLALTHDAQNGQLSTVALGSTSEARSYDDFGALSSSSATRSGAGLYSAVLERDDLGRIVQKVETVLGVETPYQYAYDQVGRLIGVSENGVIARQYAYDPNGNRLSIEAVDGSTTHTTAGAYDDQDKLISYGALSYSYTADGTLESKTSASPAETTTYTYDALGNLRAATLPDGRVLSYLVDGLNRRVAKNIDGVRQWSLLYRDQLQPVAMLNANNSVAATFVYASKRNVPEYMVASGVTYRIVSDHLGSVRLVVNVANGVVAQRMDYDEFGAVTADTSPGFQPFGFAGGLYDADTGLVRFGARDYDAVTGRWTAKDPILFDGETTNLYEYANADPGNETDPLGLTPAVAAAACFTPPGALVCGAALAVVGGIIINNASRGNKKDSGIIEALGELISAAKQCGEKAPDPCDILQVWYEAARAAKDFPRAAAIKATQKALGCRRHR